MRIIAFLMVAIVLVSVAAPPPAAQAQPASPLQVTEQFGGVQLAWQGSVAQAQPTAADGSWRMLTVQAIELPGQLVALRVPDHTPIVPHVTQLASAPLAGTLAPAAAPIPRTQAGDSRADLAAPTDQSARSLPAAPVTVLREGRMRGVRVVVLLVSPWFEQRGVRQAATSLAVFVPNAALFDQDTDALLNQSSAFLAAAPAPNNPAALVRSATLQVAKAGIQRVTGAALAAAGIALTDGSKLHVYHAGVELAIEQRDGGDGRLDAADELRFYAEPPGDRWNATDTYWLTLETTPGLRMSSRVAAPGSAPLRDNAFQSGVWRNNTLYDSMLPGQDGDHWFALDLKTGPGLASPSTLVQLGPMLPFAAGTMTATVNISAYTGGQHQITLSQGIAKLFLPLAMARPARAAQAQAAPARAPVPTLEATPALAVWSGVGDTAQQFSFPAPVAFVKLTQVAGAVPDGVELESIFWRRPAQLVFSGAGALFETDAGAWQYQLRGSAPGRTLYDVTDPRAPVIVTIPAGSDTTFQDVALARRYALSGPGLLFAPTIAAHAPIDLAAPLNADALYLAPAAFHAALAPLVALRQSQGYTVRVVDVQAIYDSWSFGQVSPEAIRSFLRYAAATWSRVPKGVTLVGDGTIDPFNYTKSNRNGTMNNLNIIPPYAAMVDPWTGETACETCYVQLDGASALDDPLPDLAIGRLPIKHLAELPQLVAKLVAYETAPVGEAWRTHNVFTADNYREADSTPDPAGDFTAAADQSIALQPSGIVIDRLYYDPTPSATGVPWREPNATAAAQRMRALLNAGAGLFNYYGHSNPYQLAVTNTDPQNGPGYLLTLYDADALTNGSRLPVILQMTCLTSAFQTPAFSGTTIDERLVLAPNGGAAAVWGSSGRGVAFGHDYLQKGFYTALWQGSPAETAAPLGTLTTAGYQMLFTQGNCCQESIHTFLLLGDPLTRLRIRRG